MKRTRRNVLRTVGSIGAATVGASAVAAGQEADESLFEDPDLKPTDTYDGHRGAIVTTNAECASGDDDADVVVSGDLVGIAGYTTAPDPCHEATIESVERDGDEAVITIGTESTLGKYRACILCLGGLEYKAVVSLRRPRRRARIQTASTVTVKHGDEVVAREENAL